MPATTFPPGALVKARGREWVVLPDSTDDVLLVRPIGGLDDEVVGICKAIEPVTSASFSLPNWEKPGDFNSCRLLRDAARLSTRSAAGPFRSFAKIAVAIWTKGRSERVFWWRIPVEFEGAPHAAGKNFVPTTYRVTAAE